MDATAVQELQKALQPLFDKLGQGAENGWNLLIRMAYMHAIELAVISVGLIVVAVVWGLVVKKLWKKAANDDSYCGDWGSAAIIASVFGGCYAIAAMIALVLNGTEIVKILYMPEFWAMQHLTSLFK
jgi:hypothetical protein